MAFSHNRASLPHAITHIHSEAGIIYMYVHVPIEILVARRLQTCTMSYCIIHWMTVHGQRSIVICPVLIAAHPQVGVNDTVNNPCLIGGAKVSYRRDVVYSGCVNSSAATEAFGFGYAPPSSLGADDVITYNGTWNYDLCMQEISSVFNFSHCWPNCQPGKNFTRPPVNGSFVVSDLSVIIACTSD